MRAICVPPLLNRRQRAGMGEIIYLLGSHVLLENRAQQLPRPCHRRSDLRRSAEPIYRLRSVAVAEIHSRWNRRTTTPPPRAGRHALAVAPLIRWSRWKTQTNACFSCTDCGMSWFENSRGDRRILISGRRSPRVVHSLLVLGSATRRQRLAGLDTQSREHGTRGHLHFCARVLDWTTRPAEPALRRRQSVPPSCPSVRTERGLVGDHLIRAAGR